MKSFQVKSFRLINLIASKVSSRLALRLAKSILLQPKKQKAAWPKDVRQIDISSSLGQLATYTYGEGKDVWLIHHWSQSSADLLPLIRKLARQGFCVHAFDLPAHGRSEGTYTNIIEMSQAFDDFAHESLMPHTIITHGLGASVVANSSFFRRYNNNLVMLNPRLNVVEVMRKVACRYGISEDTLLKVLQSVKSRYGKDLKDLDATARVAEFTGHIKTVEQATKMSTFSLIKQLA